MIDCGTFWDKVLHQTLLAWLTQPTRSFSKCKKQLHANCLAAGGPFHPIHLLQSSRLKHSPDSAIFSQLVLHFPNQRWLMLATAAPFAANCVDINFAFAFDC